MGAGDAQLVGCDAVSSDYAGTVGLFHALAWLDQVLISSCFAGQGQRLAMVVFLDGRGPPPVLRGRGWRWGRLFCGAGCASPRIWRWARGPWSGKPCGTKWASPRIMRDLVVCWAC